VCAGDLVGGVWLDVRWIGGWSRGYVGLGNIPRKGFEDRKRGEGAEVLLIYAQRDCLMKADQGFFVRRRRRSRAESNSFLNDFSGAH
jgi:hypothetical protein